MQETSALDKKPFKREKQNDGKKKKKSPGRLGRKKKKDQKKTLVGSLDNQRGFRTLYNR